MQAVRATGLSKAFGSVVAVKNLSFEVRAGESLTLLGPSGCGKLPHGRPQDPQLQYSGDDRAERQITEVLKWVIASKLFDY